MGRDEVLDAQQQMSRRERRRFEVHQRIIDSAVVLFDTGGVADTRIDDICEHADVAQKTFFNHFPTKEHLFAEIAEAFLAQVCALVEEARKERGTSGERLSRVFLRAADVAQHRGPRHRELVQEIARISALEFADPNRDGSLPQAFHSLILDGLAAGDVTRSQPTPFLAQMVVSVFQGVVMSWAHDESYELDQHLEEAARFLWRGLASEDHARTGAGE
jgi:AcrR family transcriptional regulator